MLSLPPKQQCSLFSLSLPRSFQFQRQPLASLSKTPSQSLHFSSYPSIPHNSSNKRSLGLGSPRIFQGPCLNSPASHSADDDLDVELGRLLAPLPKNMRGRVSERPELHHLIDVRQAWIWVGSVWFGFRLATSFCRIIRLLWKMLGRLLRRDIARMLANDYKKRVMIVDTSNEIGRDGDILHAGIGNAQRMQVPHSDVQHKVLIEAVENHMPQVVVIEEIGTKLEAIDASTIAQRGIQLVATAHGVTIENLVMNPLLEMLVGGI